MGDSTPNKPSLAVRDYDKADRAAVIQLLLPLSIHYPSAGDWVSRRLTDIEANRAWCLLATVNSLPAGVVISTPKGQGVAKLSTWFVGEAFQGLGLARPLLRVSRDRWRSQGTLRVYCTVDARLPQWLLDFYFRVGFHQVATADDRYGPGRDELILEFDLLSATL